MIFYSLLLEDTHIEPLMEFLIYCTKNQPFQIIFNFQEKKDTFFFV